MEKAEKWLVPALLSSVMAITMWIAADVRGLRAENSEALAKLDQRVTRSNNRLNGLCERIRVVEYVSLNMQTGSCASE